MSEFAELKLHDIMVVGDYEIIRVPGGWIYTSKPFLAENGSSVFVPNGLTPKWRPGE